MSDYQAIYDAVRSRLGGCDMRDAIESAIRSAGLDHHAAMAAEAIRESVSEHCRPSVLFKPVLTLDGNQWCALYGPDLQVGVAGFGDSPADAMWDFDRKWEKKIEPAEAGG